LGAGSREGYSESLCKDELGGEKVKGKDARKGQRQKQRKNSCRGGEKSRASKQRGGGRCLDGGTETKRAGHEKLSKSQILRRCEREDRQGTVKERAFGGETTKNNRSEAGRAPKSGRKVSKMRKTKSWKFRQNQNNQFASTEKGEKRSGHGRMNGQTSEY